MSPRRTMGLAPHVRMGLALAHKHHLVGRLTPAIVQVADAVAGGVSLSAAVAATFESFPELAGYFDGLGADVDRSFGLREEFLFPVGDHPSTLRLVNGASEALFTVEVSHIPLTSLGELLHRAAAGFSDGRALARVVGEPLDQLVPELVEGGFVQPVTDLRQPGPPEGPGVTRLQHASLLVATRTTRLLIDPHFGSLFVPRSLRAQMLPSVWPRGVDGILISHSHGDHWDLASMLMVPRDTPVIVPRVARASILAEDMAGLLRDAGFRNVHAPAWGAPAVRIGDIDVHVRPFFGEQPLAAEPVRARDLRNWGNTYFIRTPELSIWAIVDAGNDPAGTMAQEADRIADEWGGVDFLASNIRSFAVGSGRGAATYVTGLGHYWLALTPGQMAGFADLGEEHITLGAVGVAEVAARCRARYVLPYAHWWRESGTSDEQESMLAGQLAAALPDGGPVVVDWTIGERLRLQGRGLSRERLF